MPYLRSYPRGRRPRACPLIDSYSRRVRKQPLYQKRLGTKLCSSRSTHLYFPCKTTTNGCISARTTGYRASRKPASKYAKTPTTGTRTGGRKPRSTIVRLF